MSVAVRTPTVGAGRTATSARPLTPIQGRGTAKAHPSRLRSRRSAGAGHRGQGAQLGQVDVLVTPDPHWSIVLLLALRKLSTPIMVLLLMGVLPIYGWSVCTQRSWGETFTHLEQLRRDERQLVTRHETRQYEITQTVEQAPAGFEPKGPHNTLFLKPEPTRAQKPMVLPSTVLPTADVAPVGY